MMQLDRLDIQHLLDLELGASGAGLADFVARIRDMYGLNHVAYLCPSFPGGGISNPHLSVTYSDAWVEHYKREGYVSIDPVIGTAVRSILPFDWRGLPREGVKKVHRLFQDAQDAGVGRQGLTIPVRGPNNGTWAVFVATSQDNDRQWDARRYELIRDLVHVAHFTHQRACDIHLDTKRSSDLNAITRREIEALQWSAEGKTTEDIGVLLGISTETAKAHLDSVRYKLEALNRTHAVAKAIRAGLIA